MSLSVDIDLARNEFTDHDDSFGFLEAEIEPYKFITTESLTSTELQITLVEPYE